MSSKQPLNLYVNKQIVRLADDIMPKLGYSSMSGFVEDLIREKYQKVHGGELPSPSPTKSVKYRVHRGPRKNKSTPTDDPSKK
jgi:hypothetical protein